MELLILINYVFHLAKLCNFTPYKLLCGKHKTILSQEIRKIKIGVQAYISNIYDKLNGSQSNKERM